MDKEKVITEYINPNTEEATVHSHMIFIPANEIADYYATPKDYDDETLKEDKEKILNILLRYIYSVAEFPGNKLSPYWICFNGFEGESGDLSKEEYELLMKYRGKLWGKESKK